jgi:hypothetical protein
MRLDKSDKIANTLGLKTTNTFDIAECYSVGMKQMGAPSEFILRYGVVDYEEDIDNKTQIQDDKDIDIYDVWAFSDDKYECRVCRSPEAIDRCVKVEKARIPGTNKWVEAVDHVYPLCNDCMTTKLDSVSGGYVGVTMPPPTGDIIQYIQDDTSYSRSAGHIRNPGITHKHEARCSTVSNDKYVRTGTVKITNALTGKQSGFKL